MKVFFLLQDEVYFFQKSLKDGLYSNSSGDNVILKVFVLYAFI